MGRMTVEDHAPSVVREYGLLKRAVRILLPVTLLAAVLTGVIVANRRTLWVSSLTLPGKRIPVDSRAILPLPIPTQPMENVDLSTITASYPILEGLHPKARGPILSAVHPARVGLTIQDLPQSAGMHHHEPGSDYTAAADLYVGDMTDAQVGAVLDALGRAGFAAWYRIPGRDGWPSRYGPHVHAVYAGVPLKPGLQAQVRDYLKGRNGLRSHKPYAYHKFDPEAVASVRRLFNAKTSASSKRARRSRSSR